MSIVSVNNCTKDIPTLWVPVFGTEYDLSIIGTWMLEQLLYSE